MVTHLWHGTARSWREAARESSKGRVIYAALQAELQGPLGGLVMEQIRRNAAYIQSVPAAIARQMTEHVLAQSMAGLRASTIAQELRDLYPHLTQVKANLIARTEVAKTHTALVQGRAQQLGIQWYVWRTAEDQRVRKSHRLLDGVLVAWDDPPSPEALAHERSYGAYHAGETFNCRCIAQPVVDLDLIPWPARVYHAGVIQRMTRRQFEVLDPTPRRAVAAAR